MSYFTHSATLKMPKEDIFNYRLISYIHKRNTGTNKAKIEWQQNCVTSRFKKKLSTIAHSHTAKQILQKYKKYSKTFYMAFTDYNKAFDSLEVSGK